MIRFLAAVAALASVPLRAQFGIPPASGVLVTGQFQTPLKYEVVLSRLDIYYEQQIGRKRTATFPEVGPGVHFDLWHDMWVFFEPHGERLAITMKRAADSVTSRLTKGWMMEIAGKLEGSDIKFAEQPPLHSAEGDVCASRHDLERAVAAQPALKPLATWEHAGIAVSASPLTSIEMAPAGLHGAHHLTVTTETAASAKQTLARLIPAMMQPGVCAAFSESFEVDEDIRRGAREKGSDTLVSAAQSLYMAQMDPKEAEEKMRAEPEMQKRIATAAGYYDIRYRVAKPYAKVNVRWTELAGYSRENGKFESERALAQSSAAAPKPAAGGVPLTVRTKMEALKPGAYRVTLEGEAAGGQKVKIDERDYWFDGKIFEEL